MQQSFIFALIILSLGLSACMVYPVGAEHQRERSNNGQERRNENDDRQHGDRRDDDGRQNDDHRGDNRPGDQRHEFRN
jgi:hypothetical protein